MGQYMILTKDKYMNVVMIGSGNVATVLGRRIIEQGHQVKKVISRSPEQARKLASEFNCAASGLEDGAAPGEADIFIFAVSDTALFEMGKYFSLGNSLVVHTAGSVSIDVLKEVSANHGVLYPLQSMRKELPTVPEIPLMIDAGSLESLVQLETFARSVSAHVERANDEERAKMHTAAVVVSNFINHLYQQAFDFCDKEKLDFGMLQPLIEETALRLRYAQPGQLQTGPAIRNDVFTLQKHLQILSAHPKLKYLYVKMTDSIMNNQ